MIRTLKTHHFSFFAKTAFSLVAVAFLFQASPACAQTAPPDFVALSAQLLPTVVNISTTEKVKVDDQSQMQVIPQFPPGSPFQEFFKNFYNQYKNNHPQEKSRKVTALGSGFIIDAAHGYIVTNNHVIKDAEKIKVILHDNTTLDATLVGTDKKTDIAVLKVKPITQLTAAHWGDSDTAKVGSWVLAIGNPFGLGGTVTAGIVSARQRDINAGPYDDFIQTDASINRGNSGGPMFNMKGEVVGMNTAIYSPDGGSVGIGFSIPSNIVHSVVDQLIKYGKTRRGWLGVRIQEVTPEIAESIGLGKPSGVMVASVTPKGPAEKAGVKSGDVLLSFDGKPITALRKLPFLVAETAVGKVVPVTLWRKGEKKTVTVTLGQLEKAESEGLVSDSSNTDTQNGITGTKVPALGLSLAALDDNLRKSYDIKEDVRGVVVTDVSNDSPADEKGIQAGDVILEADQQDVLTPQDVIKKVESARKRQIGSILLFISRDGDRRFVALKLKK